MASSVVSGAYLVSQTAEIQAFVTAQLPALSTSGAEVFIIPDAGNQQVTIGVSKW